MLKNLILPAALVALGIIGIVWSVSVLLLTCPIARFGCNPDTRIWVFGVLLGSAILVLPRLYHAGKLALEFRTFWHEGAARQAEKRRKVKDAMRADLDRLVSLMDVAEEHLAEPELLAGEGSTIAEGEAAFSDLVRRDMLIFASKARTEPARIVAWLMINQIKEQPSEFTDRGDDIPFVSYYRADRNQQIMRLIGDKKTVALMDIALENKIGDLIAAPDMVELIQQSGLPVWRPLLTR